MSCNVVKEIHNLSPQTSMSSHSPLEPCSFFTLFQPWFAFFACLTFSCCAIGLKACYQLSPNLFCVMGYISTCRSNHVGRYITPHCNKQYKCCALFTLSHLKVPSRHQNVYNNGRQKLEISVRDN
jgi:hypothetical protein